MKLGIIAGGGALPLQLAAHCLANDIPHHVFAIAGQGYAGTASPCSVFRLGAVGTLVRIMQAQEITDAIFIGSVRRPGLWALRPDFFLLRQLPRLGLLRGGDDSLLRRIAAAFERQLGIRVRGIHEFMPDLLAPLGTIGTLTVDASLQPAVDIGIAGALALGRADRGQAVIVDALGICEEEDRTGTAAMLERFAKRNPGRPAVLVKLAKPQQDLRLDMPTIGPRTIAQAKAAGLQGIVVEAGKTLIVDQAATAAAADAAGLFLLGVRP